MAFNGNFLCTSFKVELMKGVHNFTAASNQFKLALYDNSATFTARTTSDSVIRSKRSCHTCKSESVAALS